MPYVIHRGLFANPVHPRRYSTGFDFCLRRLDGSHLPAVTWSF
jgi:hypothetical protein